MSGIKIINSNIFGGGMTKETLWTGNTTGTIYVNTSEYKLIGLVTGHNSTNQETVLINNTSWQTIGANYGQGTNASSMVAKAVRIYGDRVEQGSAIWVNNGSSLAGDGIIAVYGYR